MKMEKRLFIILMVGIVIAFAVKSFFMTFREQKSIPVTEQPSSTRKKAAKPVLNQKPITTALQPKANITTSEGLTPEEARQLSDEIAKALSGLNTEVDPAGLWDDSLPLKVRRRIARQLLRSGAPSDFYFLTEYLMSPDGDLNIKALIVESLGESSHPEARAWILSALEADEDQIVRAALRGLAATDNSADMDLFAGLLSAGTPSAIRIEAAKALGVVSDPEAGRILMDAWGAADPEDEVFRRALIEGLGQRDIDETRVFFEQLMAEETDPKVRLNVLEAISEAKGDTDSFFLDCLNDFDGRIRAEAAWNMAFSDGNHGAELSEQLSAESDPNVRKRLYEALDGQEHINLSLVMGLAEKEDRPDVELAACTLLAVNLDAIEDVSERNSTEQALIDYFEQTAVDGSTLNQRLRAVIGLRRMQTDRASAALERVISQSEDPRVIMGTGIDLTEMINSSRP